MRMYFISNHIDAAIGSRLRRIRITKGVSAADVAGWLETREEKVRRIERGEVRLRALEMFLLAARLGVPVRQFFRLANTVGPGGGTRERSREEAH